MITIRTGELFVEKYNEENHTDLKPKEIFRLLAEKAFKGGRHMINWTNSKFFVYLKEYNKARRLKKSEPSFEDALDEIKEKYGFDGRAIVTMAEVTEHLYNRECQGRVVIDDKIKEAIDKYYEQYGCK